jgi:hypothetical protein
MTKKQKFLTIISFIIFSIASVVLFLYIETWIPNCKMRDINWYEHASNEELRSVCHKVLRFPIGLHHDAFIILTEVGNKDSVPIIIRSLKWQTPPKENMMVCTTGHALESLRSLTGKEFGFEPKKWEEWWRNTGSKLPATDFFPRKK